jgi:hypothetical protein
MADGTVVAQQKVLVAAAKDPWGWRTLDRAPDKNVPGKPEAFRVSPVAGAPSVPGNVAHPMRTGDLPSAAIPTQPSKDFEISFADGVLTVTHWPVEFFAPERQILARFRVNGNVVPTGNDLKKQAMLRQEHAIGGPAQLQLEIDPAPLGAKPGDKLEMELLFCRKWTDRVSPLGVKAQELPSTGGDGDGWLLSNRVVIPGNTNDHAPPQRQAQSAK